MFGALRAILKLIKNMPPTSRTFPRTAPVPTRTMLPCHSFFSYSFLFKLFANNFATKWQTNYFKLSLKRELNVEQQDFKDSEYCELSGAFLVF